MMRIIRTTAIVAGAAMALAGCGGSSNPVTTTTPVTTPPATPAAFQTRFGTAFATDFNTSMTAEPADPAAGDVPALNLTAEPLDN